MTTDDAHAIPRFRKRSGWRQSWWFTRGIKHALLILFGLAMIYPLLWMFTSSLLPNSAIFDDNTTEAWSFDNYILGWTALGYPFGRFLLNSFLVAALSIVGTLMSCSLAAYAFARMEFRGKRILFAVMIMTIMLPFQVTIVPQYIVFNFFGLTDSFVPMILPKFLAVEAFFVFLMVQFMRGLPRNLDDAAALDGAGPLRTFWSIILPLCKPALAVTAVFTFIWTWNDFFTPLLYLNNPERFTVALGLNVFQDATGASNYGALFAMATVSLIPVFVIFLVAQRALVQGIATTGLK
jgi:multiple sugar transport system permease protein